MIEKEALAIIATVSFFKNIIWGQELEIRTDHSNLSFIQSSRTQRIQRWGILLSEYNYKIHYIPGNKNNCADWLSRIHKKEEENCVLKRKEEGQDPTSIMALDFDGGEKKRPSDIEARA